MMTSGERQKLKARAHALKPVVFIGDKGLTEAVTLEVNEALTAHELIKVKIRGQDKADRTSIAEKLCADVSADLVQHIGNTLILYRQNESD